MIDQLLERPFRRNAGFRLNIVQGIGILLFWAVCFSAGSPASMAQEAEEEQPQVIFPSRTTDDAPNADSEAVYSDLMSESGSAIGMVVTTLGYLVILGGMAVAAWYLFKRGVIRKPFSNSEGKLKVAESRCLAIDSTLWWSSTKKTRFC